MILHQHREWNAQYGFRIDDFVINRIAQRLCQCVVNDVESMSLIMVSQIFDVLENKGRRTVVIENICNGKKEVALLLILKTVLPTETQFFGNASDTEGLARK